MAGISIAVRVDPRLYTKIRKHKEAGPREFVKRMARAEALAKKRTSGPVLKVRSGLLRSSITHEVKQEGNDLVGRLGSDRVYAAIHELGGTISPRLVVPRRRRALRFMIGGRVVFAQFANIPAVTIPPRPYLDPSLQESFAGFEAAVLGEAEA